MRYLLVFLHFPNTYKHMRIFFFIIALLIPSISIAQCVFYNCGDGYVNIYSEKNKKTFKGKIRNADGSYNVDSLKKINKVFDADYENIDQRISVRLIELLDKIADNLGASEIRLTSGYRSPSYNKNLRGKGKLAASASLHQYGMAADVVLPNTKASQVAKYSESLSAGGTGYYHGRTVHIDTGPARKWDEKTSGVGLGLAKENKLIMISTDKDYYKPNDIVGIKFSRTTSAPIEINSKFYLINTKGKKIIIKSKEWKGCKKFSDIKSLSEIKLYLPKNISPGKHTIQAKFCGNKWPDMPKTIQTKEFEVR